MYKRDLLKKRVVAARDEQKDASQEFKDALTRLKEITQFDGGKLEGEYRKLQSDFDSRSESAGIQVQIAKVIADMNASIAQADEFIKGLD